MKKIIERLLPFIVSLMLAACGGSQQESTSNIPPTLPNFGPAETTAVPTAESSVPQPESSVPGPAVTEAPTTAAPVTEPVTGNGKTVCIDAGHQGKANNDKEPLGPGSSEMKTKVASGTQGRTTGVPEYVVTLQVALKLQKILEERGYTVIMTRTSHEVNISNVERAQMANEAGVDAFVRLHCNGVDNPEVNGLLAVLQTPNNPWIGDRHDEYARLCRFIVNEACAVTGAKNMGLQETDTMSGINWCQVPTALVEMGFMTNPEEDRKLVDDSYQDLLALGIANGIDAFFGFR